MSDPFGRRGKIGIAFLSLALGTVVFSQEPQPPLPATTSDSPETVPATATDGTLLLSLSGDRKFCVNRNELDLAESARKPREQRTGPVITTMGYKYQISVSRRGGSGVTKLFESPLIRTAYWETPKKSQEPPQPRLPTEKELKKMQQHTYGTNKTIRWIAENTCTTLLPEYRFPLAPGRYDVYLGFDLLGINGQWVPLESDFVTNLIVETGKTSRVEAKVDHSGGVRTVKLEAPKAVSGSGR